MEPKVNSLKRLTKLTAITETNQKKKKEREGEKTQITRIRNEKGNITTNLTEIKTIIWQYQKQLYANYLKNYQMNKFLEIYKVPKLTQEQDTTQNK